MSVFEVPAMESSDLSDEQLSTEYSDFFEEEDFRALGIDPSSPTVAKPGSEEKVVMLAARYASGLPLWHGDDRYDHGPDSTLAAAPTSFFAHDEEEDEE